MDAAEHYRAGHLQEAIAAATAQIKAKPQDLAARGLLCELLCFAGDFERADKQLDALGQLDPQALLAVSEFRHLARAEQARQQFYFEGRVPDFLEPPSPELQLRLAAAVQLRAGDVAAAAGLLEEAERQRPKLGGTCDGRRFADLRDCDDLTASIFEVLTSQGKYYWMPMERVERIEIRPFERPRDLLWRSAHVVLRDGAHGEMFLPTIYAGTAASGTEQAVLGRMTDWQGGDSSPLRGIGQRMLLVDDEDRPLLEIGELEFQVDR